MSDPARAFVLFERALDLDPSAQRRFLDAECGDDARLRGELDALLAADRESEGFLAPLVAAPRDRSGEQIGPWRLQRELGHGGMGTVYLAERADDLYARQVALKLLRFDVGDLRARFANERRLLAALEHPNIARLLDAGTDAGGAPYVAMEYVEGEAITHWCDARTLDLRARVMLFLKVLDAVQSAHGRLIVHRDLKPANILVDASGEPKLLDFGIAKLIDSDTRGLTVTGFAPLTPEYASPEQVRGEPIGTASDIYALGVLLFELCVGERPYRFASGSSAQIERIVCDVPPPRPSARVQRERGRRIDRDIDHVILKAMAKTPVDRYASCAQFADDLRRYLGGQPVLATHAGWRYRTNKFVRRNRVPVALASLAFTALTISAVIALSQAHAAREQARIARAERDNAQRVNAFLQTMLAAADPAELGRKATVVEVLDRARHRAEREFAADPATLVTTELTLAKTYHALGENDAARHSAEAALAAAQRDGQAAEAVDAQIELGDILSDLGDLDTAAAILREARMHSLARSDARQRADAATALGSVASRRGDAAQAVQWFETALRELPPAAIDARGNLLTDLGVARNLQGDRAGALALQRQVVDLLRQAHPNGHPELAKALGVLGGALEIADRFDEAAAAYAEAVPMQIDLLGETHPFVVQTLSSITNLSLRRGDGAAALRDGARAWKAARALPPDHPMAAYAAVMYAQALCAAGRGREALPLIEQSLVARKAKLPSDHPLIASTESLLGLAEAQSGDLQAGEALARAAYERQVSRLGADHEMTVVARERLRQIEALRHTHAASD